MNEPDFRLQIYKVYVDTIISTENRRLHASTVYLGMIAAVATFSGTVSEVKLIYPVTVTLAISTVWWLTVKYFRKLAQAKFSVIAELEKDLPIAVFELEWKAIKDNRSRGPSLTQLEMVLPIVTAALCAVYILFYTVSALKIPPFNS